MGGVVVDRPVLNSKQQGVCHGAAQTKKVWIFGAGNPPLRALLIIPSAQHGIFSIMNIRSPPPYECVLYSNVHQFTVRVRSEKSLILKYKCLLVIIEIYIKVFTKVR